MENIPPKIFKRYGGEILEIKEGESCVVQFDVKEEDYNPLGVTLGGMYGVYIDLVMGLFSYLTTKKGCASLDLNLDFLKSLGPGDDKIKIKTILVHQTRNYLLFTAEAYNERDDLLATGKSRMKILGNNK